jgi:DNA-binding transcriptional MerR regulator
VRRHEGRAYYTVGEVAGTIGVSSQTLRVWERKGLLVPARSEGKQRLYSEDDVRRAEQVATLRRRHGWNAAAIRSVAGIVHSETWQHLSLGMRIRTARRERGLTLGKAASHIGISPSFLSTLERGESGVSVQILARIADALEMPMSAFAPVRPVDAIVLRKDERPRTVLTGGVTWEELVSPGHTFEPAVLIVPSNQDSGGPITRPGEIFVLVLAGSLTFLLHDQGSEVVVDEEDAIVLAAASPWSWENRESREARALWVEQLPPGAWDAGPPETPKAGTDP